MMTDPYTPETLWWRPLIPQRPYDDDPLYPRDLRPYSDDSSPTWPAQLSSQMKLSWREGIPLITVSFHYGILESPASYEKEGEMGWERKKVSSGNNNYGHWSETDLAFYWILQRHPILCDISEKCHSAGSVRLLTQIEALNREARWWRDAKIWCITAQVGENSFCSSLATDAIYVL